MRSAVGQTTGGGRVAQGRMWHKVVLSPHFGDVSVLA